MYLVRNFKPSDLDEVMEIADESLTERYFPQLFMDIYEAWPRGFLVAEFHKILGFIAGSKIANEARILMLAVRKEYRRRGIGSALLKKFMAVCKSEGLVSIRLEVRTSNIDAIEFYKRFGFHIISFIPNYYTNGDAAYVMWRMI